MARGSSVRRRCRPEDPYFLLYTSGTTGRPKGVITPHRQVAWNAYNTMACWQLSENDVSPIFTPLYHAGGLGAFLMPLLLAGGTVVLHAGFDATEVWSAIENERCTVVLGVPTIWKMLADAPEFETVDLSRRAVVHLRRRPPAAPPHRKYFASAASFCGRVTVSPRSGSTAFP